jgi:hypothetical protein
MGRAARMAISSLYINRWSAAIPQPNDLSRSLVALDQDSTIIAVVEMSQSSWLVGGVLPGIERQPRKKLEPSSERLLALLHRWRDESVRAGHTITRIAVAFEAGRDGFWLARWLEARGVEAHVIHSSSAAPRTSVVRRRNSRSPSPVIIAPANLIAGDGTRNGLSAPNKKPATTKQPLDRKLPYKSANFWFLMRAIAREEAA